VQPDELSIRDQLQLRGQLLELAKALKQALRVADGQNFQLMKGLLLRADLDAGILLGKHRQQAYTWLRLSWQQAQAPPPAVAQALKVSVRQLVSWLRQHLAQPITHLIPPSFS